MKTLRITVTEKDIKNGRKAPKDSATQCPIARAVRRARLKDNFVCVTHATISVDDAWF